MTDRVRTALRWIVFAVAVGIVVRFARSLDWSATWAAMRRASPPLLFAAALVNLGTLLARAIRWSIFLGDIGVASRALGLRSAIIGSGFSNVLPASGGDPLRVLLVAQRARVSKSGVLAALALDRFADVATYAALLLIAPLVLPVPALLRRWRVPIVAVVVAGAIGGALVMQHAARRERARGVAAMDADLARAARDGIGASVARFAAALAMLRRASSLSWAVALSLVGWAAQVLTYHLVARSAHVDAPLYASAAAVLAVNLSFLVQATPGNVGVLQVIYALVMSGYGVPKEAAVGVAVLIQAVQILPVTAMAVPLAWWERRAGRVDARR